MIPAIPWMLRTETVEACSGVGLPVRVLLIDPEDEGGYAALLRRLWRSEREWVLVEQDVVPPRGALRAMVACTGGWCTLPHWVGSHWETRSLGVARFSLGLRRRYPDLADQALGGEGTPYLAAPWRSVDMRLARWLAILGVEPHVHPGRTCHLRTYGVHCPQWPDGDRARS